MRISACRKIEDYRQSILHVGGEVRLVDASMSVDEALAGIEGLLLTGGDDVAPSRYGEPSHAAVVEAEPGRDEFEIASDCRRRAPASLPIFAICRGIQVLNVACGGTLVQDIPSQRPWRAASQPAGAAASSRTSSRTKSGSTRTRSWRG